MEKRFQIFVSSTHKDLYLERAAVTESLTKVGFIAIGMEQFPATDEAQMEYICPLINESDYYIVIIKGRYGEINEDGKSYTEAEFDYAVSIGRPAVAFLFKNEGAITLEETDQNPECAKRLSDFKDKLKRKKIVRFWTDKQELCDAVKDTIYDLERRRPGVGWVRGDQAADLKTFQTLEGLRDENASLRLQLDQLQVEGAIGLSEYSGGNDQLLLSFKVDNNPLKPKVLAEECKLTTTWSQIIDICVDLIYEESSEGRISLNISQYFAEMKGWTAGYRVNLEKGTIQKLRYQFEALGLIETTGDEEENYRFVRWKFTSNGKKYIARVKAERRSAIPD